MAVILIGPQGSGKGTQSALLRKAHHFSYIAGGNIARELARHHNELGHEVRALMDEGKLLPDRILNDGVRKTIQHHQGKALLFDGYPRTLDQAKFLRQHLEDHGYTILVLELDLDDAESIKRIQSRYICSACGSIIYSDKQSHLSALQKYRMSRHVCIHCGGTLVKRSDDTEESVRHRLSLYHRQTKPVIDYFSEHATVKIINAKPPVDDVFEDVMKIVKSYE